MEESQTANIWQDITQLAQDAQLELSAQLPMISNDNFSLFEAMSAVEVCLCLYLSYVAYFD